MIKKSITYKDFNDNEVTEDFYFHLYEADVIEMQFGEKGGLDSYLKRIFAEEDGQKIYGWLKHIILRSVGKQSPDGRRFITNAEIRDDFESSPAFSRLIMEFFKDPEQAAKFINSIVPQGMKDELAHIERPPNRAERRHPGERAETMEAQMGPRPAAMAEADPTAVEPEQRADWNVFSAENPKILTRAELVEMDSEELRSGLAEGRYKLQ